MLKKSTILQEIQSKELPEWGNGMKKLLGLLLLLSSFLILQASEARKNSKKAHNRQTWGGKPGKYKKAILTDHVLEQAEKRGISVKQINSVVTYGEQERGTGGAIIYVEKGKSLEHPIMAVIDPSCNIVITVYRKGLEPDALEQELHKQKVLIHKLAYEALIKLKNDKSIPTEERIKKRRAIKADEKKKQAEVGAHYAQLMKEKEGKEKANEGSTDIKS